MEYLSKEGFMEETRRWNQLRRRSWEGGKCCARRSAMMSAATSEGATAKILESGKRRQTWRMVSMTVRVLPCVLFCFVLLGCVCV